MEFFLVQVAKVYLCQGPWLLATGYSHLPYDIVGSSSMAESCLFSGALLSGLFLSIQLGKALVVRRAHSEIAPFTKIYEALWAKLLAEEEVHCRAAGNREVSEGLSAITQAMQECGFSPVNRSGFEGGPDSGFSRCGSTGGVNFPNRLRDTSGNPPKLQQPRYPLMLLGGKGPWDAREGSEDGEWGTPETSLDRLCAAAAAIDPTLRRKVLSRGVVRALKP